MTLTPPQGAQSADPVRDLIDKIKAACREKPTALNGYGLKLWEQIESALRTALAAPEGPAPTDALDRPQHCRDCLTACHDCPAGFVPLAAAPEAPPPVEARQPPNLNFVHDVLQNCRGMLPEKDGAHAEIGKAMEIIRAALAAPAGAIQPPLGHTVAHPVPLPDAASEGRDTGSTCVRCGGTGMVDDGELAFYEGTNIPYENGPIKCVKDCPACGGKS